MGRDVEVIPAGVDTKVQGFSGGGADKTGNALLVAFVQTFSQGEKEGHHADFFHLQVREDTDVAVGFQEFAGIAMVEGADKGAHDLLSMGPAENVGVSGDVGTVPGMAVVIDNGAGVMEKAGSIEKVSHAIV